MGKVVVGMDDYNLAGGCYWSSDCDSKAFLFVERTISELA